MRELWYRVGVLPDLGLNKYASLDGSGVDGVLEKHIAFLRQWNRKGVLSGISLHLFYLYLRHEDTSLDRPGRRLEVLLLVRGEDTAMENVPSLINASPLSDFYAFTEMKRQDSTPDGIDVVFDDWKVGQPIFKVCSVLTKSESLLPAGGGESDDYYMIREWDMNEDGRLYNMCKLMEALNQTALFRVDLYPVERSRSLREAFRKPVSVLRRRQDEKSPGNQRDYEGKNVLDRYEEIMEQFESSPHFIANILVFAKRREDSAAILDAAGAEALKKGKYSVATFTEPEGFSARSFIKEKHNGLESIREGMVLRPGKVGLIICREDTANLNLNYLPTLFSLEEISPFFRFPALFEGEVIQKPKETAPPAVSNTYFCMNCKKEYSGDSAPDLCRECGFSDFRDEKPLFIGKDENGYDVNFPLTQLPKHAFLSGVPGSGKTNAMQHIMSSLWKEHNIPFLVLEPAKQEYRALANDPGMEDIYIFSPNADMSFPLHINPFEMPKGIMVAEHIRRLCSVFEGAFPLDNPMPFLLDTAIEAVYRELGWIPEHIYTGEEMAEDGVNRKHLPTMSMLYQRLEDELKSTRYSEEVRGNLESALKVRIGSLLRREMGDVFDVPESTFAPEKWLQLPAVVELESMGTGPANFLTLMLCALIRESIKAKPQFDGSVRHVLFIEEAHNLIGPESEDQTGADANPKQAATAFLVKMLAEVRALKESIVIADQLPTAMAAEVIKNTGLKIGLRITSADDRSLLGSTMAASGLQLERMATFEPGEALIFYEGLMRPFRMRVKEWWGEIADKIKKDSMIASKDDNDLRVLLSERRTYKEENLMSIQIIGKKYKRLIDDLKERGEPQVKWCTAVGRLKKDIARLDAHLSQIYNGRLTVSQEEVDRQNDDRFRLQAQYDTAIGNKTKIKTVIGLIMQAGDWVYSLDRLKSGRWKRFKAPEKALRQISALQLYVADFVFELYRLIEPFYDMAQANPRLAASMNELSELCISLEQYILERPADLEG